MPIIDNCAVTPRGERWGNRVAARCIIDRASIMLPIFESRFLSAPGVDC